MILYVNQPNMFQKLYKHLEEVNSTLRRQELAAGTSSTYEKEIIKQLQHLNETIKAGQRDSPLASPLAVKKRGRLIPVVIAALACVAVGAIVVLGFRLSDLTRAFVNTQEKASRQSQTQREYSLEQENLHTRQLDVTAQITRLDSIISQENQALMELKELNKASVHTFMRLRYRMDRTDHLIRSMQGDSANYIGRAR